MMPQPFKRGEPLQNAIFNPMLFNLTGAALAPP
jgi:hypothetical protein